MFDLLKKKLSNFTSKLKDRVEKKGKKAVEGQMPEEVAGQAEGQAAEEAGKAISLGEKTVEAPAFKERAAEEALIAGDAITAEKAEVPREIRARVSAAGRIKRAIVGKVKIEENDLKQLLWDLELALLEADVEQTTAEEICKEIRKHLAGKEIGRRDSIDEVLKEEIRKVLGEMMRTEAIDLLKRVKDKKDKPFKILFLGPNGAGKTTSIAKLSHFLMENGFKVIWSASDTFRAASIEQLEKHASKLGVRVVKHQYGADPAAVAFDAVKAAQSKKIDTLIIDSAGRQETNRNLMEELRKIVRVTQPDLTVYVGEAFTGQALLQQAKDYDKIAGIDAFILTKIDCDAKGGTTISLLYKLKKPILFVGTGQEYKDLKKFEPEFVLKRVVG